MDIQYLAGLVDGEGHITVYEATNGRGERHHRALIRIVQSENNQGEQLCDLIKVTYGGCICYKAKYHMYEWSIYGKQAVALATLLQPHLIVKAYQIERVLGGSVISGRVVSI